MRALKSMTYGDLQLRAGDEFDATDADADLLPLVKVASKVTNDTLALEAGMKKAADVVAESAKDMARSFDAFNERVRAVNPSSEPKITYKHRKKRHYNRRDLTAEE